MMTTAREVKPGQLIRVPGLTDPSAPALVVEDVKLDRIDPDDPTNDEVTIIVHPNWRGNAAFPDERAAYGGMLWMVDLTLMASYPIEAEDETAEVTAPGRTPGGMAQHERELLVGAFLDITLDQWLGWSRRVDILSIPDGVEPLAVSIINGIGSAETYQQYLQAMAMLSDEAMLYLVTQAGDSPF